MNALDQYEVEKIIENLKDLKKDMQADHLQQRQYLMGIENLINEIHLYKTTLEQIREICDSALDHFPDHNIVTLSIVTVIKEKISGVLR